MKHFHFNELESTADEAYKIFKKGEPTSFAVTATTQTKGRGRRGAVWVSNPGNVYLSMCMDPQIFSFLNYNEIALYVALETALTLEQLTEKSILLKWPNDLYLNNKKMGGVLIEAHSQAHKTLCFIVSIGINLTFQDENFSFLNTKISLDEIIQNLIHHFEYPRIYPKRLSEAPQLLCGKEALQTASKLREEYNKKMPPAVWKDKDTQEVFISKYQSLLPILELTSTVDSRIVKLENLNHNFLFVKFI